MFSKRTVEAAVRSACDPRTALRFLGFLPFEIDSLTCWFFLSFFLSSLLPSPPWPRETASSQADIAI